MQQNVRPQRDKKKTINSGALWHNIEMALATDNSINKNKLGKKKKIRVSARLGTTNHSPAKIMHLREMFTKKRVSRYKRQGTYCSEFEHDGTTSVDMVS